MSRTDSEKMTFLKAFTHVGPERGCIVRIEVRRDPISGLTLMTRTPLTLEPPVDNYRQYASAH